MSIILNKKVRYRGDPTGKYVLEGYGVTSEVETNYRGDRVARTDTCAIISNIDTGSIICVGLSDVKFIVEEGGTQHE